METIVRLLADGLLIGIALVGLVMGAIGFPWRHWRREAPYAVMAGLTSLLAAKLASLVFQPSPVRPFLEQGAAAGAAYVNNPGFPSDHMLVAAVIVGALYALTPYKKTAIVIALLAVVMGVARVLALVHTPIDIIGGVAAGLVGCLWYLKRSRE